MNDFMEDLVFSTGSSHTAIEFHTLLVNKSMNEQISTLIIFRSPMGEHLTISCREDGNEEWREV